MDIKRDIIDIIDERILVDSASAETAKLLGLFYGNFNTEFYDELYEIKLKEYTCFYSSKIALESLKKDIINLQN